MEMEVVLVLEVVLEREEVERYLLAAQEQMDQRQAQEQMQDQIQVLAVAVAVVVELRDQYQQELEAMEDYQLYITGQQLRLPLAQMGLMFQLALHLTLLVAVVAQQVFQHLQWQEATEDSMARVVVEAVAVAVLRLAKAAMVRKELWL
jgi:hypothetical protein